MYICKQWRSQTWAYYRACALPSTFQALPSAAQQTHVIPQGIKQESKYSSYSS